MVKITKLEKVNAIACALWGTKLNNDVRTIAVDVEAELDKLGYDLIKRRYDKKGLVG